MLPLLALPLLLAACSNDGGNRPPVADAGEGRRVFLRSKVWLDAGNSFDPDHDPLVYEWSLISQPPGDPVQIQDHAKVLAYFYPESPGNYVVRLAVSDGKATSTDTITLAGEVNQKPVANAGTDQTVNAGENVTLDGSASHDPNGSDLSYLWTMTAKPAESDAVLLNATTARAAFMADAPGEYRCRLVVNDGALESDPDEVVITAVAPPGP